MSWKVPLPIAQGFAKKKKERERDRRTKKQAVFKEFDSPH